MNLYKFFDELIISQAPLPNLNFEVNQIVDGPHVVTSRPIIGLVLRIPENVCAVLTLHNGRQQTLVQGSYRLRVRPGSYTIQYINCQRFSLSLTSVSAPCSDAWNTSLSVEIIWRAGEATSFIAIGDPLETLRKVAEASIKSCIQNMPHDELVGTPLQPPLLSEEIASRIKRNILSSRACGGIRIIDVLVLDRQGDRRRTDVIQKTIISTTQLDQDRIVQQAQTSLKDESLSQSLHLANGEEALAIKQAEIVRLKTEEEEQTRLRLAEITADVSRILRPSRLQEVEIHQLEVAPKLEQELKIKLLETWGEVFKSMASVAANSAPMPASSLGLSGGGSDQIMRLAESFAHGTQHMATSSLPSITFNGSNEPQQRSLREQLAAELSDLILNLPGASCNALEAVEQEKMQVTIGYLRAQFVIVCNTEYPYKAPSKITVKQDGYPNPQPLDIQWREGMNLRSLVLQAYHQIPTVIQKLPERSNGKDAYHSKPLAI